MLKRFFSRFFIRRSLINVLEEYKDYHIVSLEHREHIVLGELPHQVYQIELKKNSSEDYIVLLYDAYAAKCSILERKIHKT